MRNEKITPFYERLSRNDDLQGESNSKCATRFPIIKKKAIRNHILILGNVHTSQNKQKEI